LRDSRFDLLRARAKSLKGKLMKSSWKTSLGGIGMIAGGIASGCHALQQKPIDSNSLAAAATAIAGGFGLLFARDHSVSDEDAGQAPVQRQAQATADLAIAAHAAVAAPPKP
jgi:hypothetical protein